MTAISGYLLQHDEDIYENQNRGLFGSNILKFRLNIWRRVRFYLLLLLLSYLFGSYVDEYEDHATRDDVKTTQRKFFGLFNFFLIYELSEVAVPFIVGVMFI